MIDSTQTPLVDDENLCPECPNRQTASLLSKGEVVCYNCRLKKEKENCPVCMEWRLHTNADRAKYHPRSTVEQTGKDYRITS